MQAICKGVKWYPAHTITHTDALGIEYIRPIESELLLTVSVDGGDLVISIKPFFLTVFPQLNLNICLAIAMVMPQTIEIKVLDSNYVVKSSDLSRWQYEVEKFLGDENEEKHND